MENYTFKELKMAWQMIVEYSVKKKRRLKITYIVCRSRDTKDVLACFCTWITFFHVM